MPRRLDLGPIELLILQPTPFCNINCSYCYLPHRNDKSRMSFEVVEAAFKTVLRSRFVSERITVVWHAGEPLTLPPAWYRQAFALAERWRPDSVEVAHHFQTNGLLLDADWVNLFHDPRTSIGLSIDGPADLHDLRRRTRAGGGTHARAMRGLGLLQEAGIGFHVISVLTAETLDRADELYDFYVTNGITQVAFNIDEIDGENTQSTFSATGAEQSFRRFLARFIDRMGLEPGRLMLRELTDMLGVISAGGLHGRHAQDAEPMRILSVSVDGRIATYSPELLGTVDPRYGDFCFGDIKTDELDDVAERIVGSRLSADIRAGIDACARECAWFHYCGGGLPGNKLGETGSLLSTETMFCRLMRQSLLDVVLTAVESSVAAPGIARVAV